MTVPEPPYSKRQVNRAGELLRDVARGLLDLRDESELTAAREAVEYWRDLHTAPLSAVAAALRHGVSSAGADERAVTQRLKRFATLIDKLDRHPGTLTQMEDIGGVRAVLPDQRAVDAVLSAVQDRWQVRRVREYIDGRDPGPKADGYRAVHVVVIEEKRFIEIQLRTPSQDHWAQLVERATRRSGQALKFGGGSGDLREFFRMRAELAAAQAAGVSVDSAFLARLAELDQLIAHHYDPEGDVS